MVRVAVNGSFLARPPTGVQRYARELSRALCSLPGRVYEIVLIVPPGAPPSSVPAGCADHLMCDESPLPVALWVQVKLPILFRRIGAHLLWSPSNTGPIALRAQVVTIHDASFCQPSPWFSRSFRTYYRALLPRLARRVRRVVTVSEFSRRELARAGVGEARDIAIVGNGIEELFRPTPPPERVRELQPYVLAVGGGNPRKNTAGTVAAWKLLSPSARGGARLVVLGENPGIYGEENAARGRDIVTLPHVHEDELPGLYSGAQALLYPSLYEGFGRPPLEALACGTPSVAAAAGSLPEVLENAALFADPHSPQDIARQLARLLRDGALRKRILARGPAILAYYRWSQRAAEFDEIIRGALDS